MEALPGYDQLSQMKQDVTSQLIFWELWGPIYESFLWVTPCTYDDQPLQLYQSRQKTQIPT